MSGYGGQPPPWEGAHGRPGWDPQGDPSQQAWRQPHPGYEYGPPGVPTPSGGGSGAAVGALICNILLTMFLCNPFAIIGIVIGAIATGKVQSQPESARKLTIWSWELFAVGLVAAVAFIVIAALLGAFDGEPTGYSEF